MFAPGGFAWAIVTLIGGILIIVFPSLLRWIVGIYLIVVAIAALIG